MADPRSEELQTFLDVSGFSDCDIVPLAGDASNRRYFRLYDRRDRPFVLMDAPPARGEDTHPFVSVTQLLRGASFSAPEIIASDPEQGFLLLEDLGDALYARVLEMSPDLETELYAAAVDLLAAIDPHAAPELAEPSIATSLPAYDEAILLREAELFTDWYLPHAGARGVSDDCRAQFRELVSAEMQPIAADRSVVVMRDYHSENLLWLPERDSHARVGLLDYQDALAGHPAYDLVSLLEDARRDTSAELREAMIDRYLAQKAWDKDTANAFKAAYSLLGAQRNLKIVGIFARLALRDGKPRYLDLIPRVWDHLMRDITHPELRPLRDWLSEMAPAPSADVLSKIRQTASEKRS